MALDKETKERLIADYSRGFAVSPNAFVLGFSGLSVPQADELRARVRERGGRYQVVKNRLALIALKDTGMEALAEHFQGPTAVAYSDDDVVGLAKILTDFAKEAEVLEFRGGLLDGSPIEAGQIKAIAELPSREELIAKLLFLLHSPIARMVRGLGGLTQQLVSVVEQIRRQKESEPQPAPEPPAEESAAASSEEAATDTSEEAAADTEQPAQTDEAEQPSTESEPSAQ